MPSIGNWVGEYSTTTGAGQITLASPIAGYSRFSDIGDGLVWYTIIEGHNRETGSGVLTGNVLSRDNIDATLINGFYNDVDPGAITLVGVAQVYCTFSEAAYQEIHDHLLSPDERDAMDGASSPSISNPIATINDIASSGGGDMLKVIYDINNSGVVDDSELLAGLSPAAYDQSAHVADVTTNPHNVDATDIGAAPIDHNHDGVYEPDNPNIQAHIADVTTNPHSVDFTDVGAAPLVHNHDGVYEPANANIQGHIADSDLHLSADERGALDNSPTPPTAANSIATQADIAAAGGGDMLKAVYDVLDSGIVDDSELLGGLPPSTYNQSAHAADVTTNPHAVSLTDVGGAPLIHNHDGVYEPANANIQDHITDVNNLHLTIDERASFDNSPSAATGANPLATQADIAAAGGGDMLKAVYDALDSGVVDDSERLGGQLPSVYDQSTHAADVLTNPHNVTVSQVGGAPLVHDHDGVYEPANANIQSHISDVTTNPHNVTAAQAGAEPVNANIQAHIADVTTNPHNVTLSQVGGAPLVHDHDGVYEPVISPKNTAFNKNFGTIANSVCEGDDARLSDDRPPDAHTHSAADTTSGTFNINRIPTGTTGTTVALGNHNHDLLYLGIGDKAADSDLLDGINSSSFLRSNSADSKTSGDLTFNDNIAANFGTGSDIEMYFDGTNFYTDLNNSADWFIRDAAGSNRFTLDGPTGNLTILGDMRSDAIITSDGVNNGTVTNVWYDTGDGKNKRCTKAHFIIELGLDGSSVIDSGSNANGYYRLWSDGYIEQWSSITSGSDQTVSFPLAYSDAASVIVVGEGEFDGHAGGVNTAPVMIGVPTTTTFRSGVGGTGAERFAWHSRGY